MKKFLVRAIVITFIICLMLSTCSCGASKSGDAVKIIDIPLTEEEYVFVCKKGNIALVESFNQFLDEIKASGEFDALMSKYFEGKGEKSGYPVSVGLRSSRPTKSPKSLRVGSPRNGRKFLRLPSKEWSVHASLPTLP